MDNDLTCQGIDLQIEPIMTLTFMDTAATFDDLFEIKDPKQGSVYICADTNTPYVYFGEYFTAVGEVDEPYELPKIRRTNCCNCNAPLEDHGGDKEKCRYCGTTQSAYIHAKEAV